jgi:hypothetical protein
VPRISRRVGGDSSQTYAMGGYSGLTHKGNLDSLLPSELAYPDLIFKHRLLNNECLYYARESETEKRKKMVYIVTQMGLEMQGDVEVLARALTLALARVLTQRGYVVRQSFAGSVCSEDMALDRAAGVHRLLYYRDNGRMDTQNALESVLQRLRTWGEEFRGMTVCWVVGEFWDADYAEEHWRLYEALRQKARQEAWLLVPGQAPKSARIAPGANLFDRVEAIGTDCLWENESTSGAGVSSMAAL